MLSVKEVVKMLLVIRISIAYRTTIYITHFQDLKLWTWDIRMNNTDWPEVILIQTDIFNCMRYITNTARYVNLPNLFIMKFK